MQYTIQTEVRREKEPVAGQPLSLHRSECYLTSFVRGGLALEYNGAKERYRVILEFPGGKPGIVFVIQRAHSSFFRIGTQTAILLLLQAFPGLRAAPYEDPVPRSRQIQTIGFGSCLRQDLPAPALEAIARQSPDLFLFLGDNIYADTTSESVLREQYNRLAQREAFQKLSQQSVIHAIWDDHDYGENDAGGDFEFRRKSEKIFKRFWGVANSKPYASREGVYAAFLYRTAGQHPQKVQIILMDTRSFRSPLETRPFWEAWFSDRSGPYVPSDDPDKTMLGEEQWKWLAYQFSIQADLRIVVSSIQVLSESDGWESWSTLPLERERLLDLAVGGSSPVLFLSGDRHFAEMSALQFKGKTLLDVTSSSLNQFNHFKDESNPLRLGARYSESNYGWIILDDSKPRLRLQIEIRDAEGKTRIAREVRF